MDKLPTFHPEFGRFMLEATPGKPWGIGFQDLLDVEPNMRWRYDLFGLGSVSFDLLLNGRFQTTHSQGPHGTK